MGRSSARGPAGPRPRVPRRRGCALAAKHREGPCSRNGRSASWAAHGTYLPREGAQREGGKGRGFSADQEGIDLPATPRSWQRAGDERLWKFIASPEHAERLDLKALVSHVVRDLGTRLDWVAIDHYNTDTRTSISSSAVETLEARASRSIRTT